MTALPLTCEVVPNANDATRPATLTVRLDQFSSLEEFARGYRQHVTRTTLYLPTRLQRPEGSLLLFRIELAGGMCAFRGEGAVESYRRTPGGEQLGMMLRLRRLDKASKELHTSAFAGVQESTAPAAERGDPMAEIGSLLAAVGAAGEDALASLASEAAAGPARERAVVSRNEGDAPLQMRDDLRAHSRSAHEVVTRPLDAAALALVESEAGEQPQSVGRMAVSRMSVDEYEARKLAMARVAALPPVASLVSHSESSAAWSEADDALDFEGIGSDLRASVSVTVEPAPVRAAPVEEVLLPPSPTLPPLEGIVVAPPQDAVGGGVAVDEVTFSGSSAYEMPIAAPLEPAADLDLEFDFTAVSFTSEPPVVVSGNRQALPSGAIPQVAPVDAEPEAASVASDAPARASFVPSPAAAVGPSRLPPAPPPRSGAPVSTGVMAPAARQPLPMSKPIPKPTPAEAEDKPGLFGWLRGKK
jgi:hypothetical protein